MEYIGELLRSLSIRYDDKTFKLIDCSIKRVLENMYRDDAQAAGMELALYDPYHIADWLKTSIMNNEHWLQNVDSLGRPKKLMKCGTLEALTHEADKAMMKALQRNGSVDLIEGDEELFMELEDGYRLVKLLTPIALDREGYEMQHCIGGGSYDEYLDDTCLYLSLRDRFNKAHATLEIFVEEMALSQFQGKQNRCPDRKYGEIIRQCIVKYGITDKRKLFTSAYKFDANGVIFDLNNMPDGIVLNGLVYFREDTPITRLPDDFTVRGELVLKECQINKLPRGLRIEGDVTGNFTLISDTINEIPDDLYVSGDLYIIAPQITEIPDSVHVGGDITLNDVCLHKSIRDTKFKGF